MARQTLGQAGRQPVRGKQSAPRQNMPQPPKGPGPPGAQKRPTTGSLGLHLGLGPKQRAAFQQAAQQGGPAGAAQFMANNPMIAQRMQNRYQNRPDLSARFQNFMSTGQSQRPQRQQPTLGQVGGNMGPQGPNFQTPQGGFASNPNPPGAPQVGGWAGGHILDPNVQVQMPSGPGHWGADPNDPRSMVAQWIPDQPQGPAQGQGGPNFGYGPGAGMNQQLYANQGQPNFGQQSIADQMGMPGGFDMNPNTFGNYMQGMFQQEQQYPGSTMLGGRPSFAGGQQMQPMPRQSANYGATQQGMGGGLQPMGGNMIQQGQNRYQTQQNPFGVNQGMQSVLRNRAGAQNMQNFGQMMTQQGGGGGY